jgi:hypothetical protein
MPSTTVDAIRPLYAFVDPHGGSAGAASARLKRVASQAAIVVGGRDARNYYILDAWSARCSTDELVEKMFSVHAKWNLRTMGGEENGLAGLFHDAVLREAKWRGTPLPLLKVRQPTHLHKDYRIRTRLQTIIGHGRLIVARGLDQLVQQITDFPLSPLKDQIDACASLVDLMPSRPAPVERNREREAKLKYLRNRGVDPQVIAKYA